ncbi:hypothetical protein SAMN05216215_1034101 [Saccharopolyspora shandongensis]|uniref:Uncharacterized protein n=1 Tax=Saccharopolyspora shandongensis TaxID=418495 RepID=A0A1H3MMI3_9PSEU|nr:hypothetical protein [Saccharopolyspora shandongensis]SDY77289.1 hypothetical protein SAMN05216215_1034101 [Saccharopolyspora shandongensis]
MLRVPPPDFGVPYSALAFPPGTVPRSGVLTFSVDDLAHALIVTGRAPGDRLSHGAASVWEWLHRASLIPAYLRRTYRAELVRSDLALSLDRSESAALSYTLGQAITGIFCQKLLSVTHLMHIDRYASEYRVGFGNTRKRSDLFGLAPAGWVVAEAKGRAGAMDLKLRRRLEAQKRSVVSIDGEKPWVALGCVASFPVRGEGMRIDAVDPEEEEIEPISLDAVTRDRFALAYYLPVLRALDFGGAVDADLSVNDFNETFVATDFANFGLRLALPRALVARLRGALDGELAGLHDSVHAILDDVHSRELQVLPDGARVETDWSSALAVGEF